MAGTIYYQITLDDVSDAYSEANCIVFEAINLYGWGAFDIERYLITSEIVDDVPYVSVTDGNDTELDGDW